MLNKHRFQHKHIAILFSYTGAGEDVFINIFAFFALSSQSGSIMRGHFPIFVFYAIESELFIFIFQIFRVGNTTKNQVSAETTETARRADTKS